MLKVITKEIPIDEELKTRIQFICDFCNTTPTFINGSIRKIQKTNINYIEPNKIIIEGTTFLAFMAEMFMLKLLVICIIIKLLVKKLLIELQVGIMI